MNEASVHENWIELSIGILQAGTKILTTFNVTLKERYLQRQKLYQNLMSHRSGQSTKFLTV
jgi:hypothetical protein